MAGTPVDAFPSMSDDDRAKLEDFLVELEESVLEKYGRYIGEDCACGPNFRACVTHTFATITRKLQRRNE